MGVFVVFEQDAWRGGQVEIPSTDSRATDDIVVDSEGDIAFQP